VSRDDDLAKLAGLMGWRLFIPPTGRRGFRAPYFDLNPRSVGAPCEIPIPAPDAPLPEAMAFVGRLCEAIGSRGFSLNVSLGYHARVNFRRIDGMRHPDSGGASEDRVGDDDLVWAAVRAAIAAKGGAT
jgi:hypothetical protein